MEYYLDPHVTGVNRLPARARRFDERAISLNGRWLFRLYDRPEDCGDFFSRDTDESDYKPIAVPGNWELQGFGRPVYTNCIYPWDLSGENGVDGRPCPWRVPKDNPTGCYRTRFDLRALPEEDVILRFDGVETAYELYVNGVFAGYAEDSKLSSEFDVTALVRQGENLIALRVFTFATSSYLEDQDYWYLCGIHRGVSLICVPKARIEDYVIQAVADETGSGALFSADVKTSRVHGYAERRVRVTLCGPSGAVVAEKTAPVMAEAAYTTIGRPTAGAARVSVRLDSVKRWSPERPVLYSARIELLDSANNVVDRDVCRIGFKRVEIVNGILRINGRRALLFGVNRHEHAWLEGRAVSREHMMREIREMKRMNINAVRTCHYPDSPAWFDLCDEMGLLVLCECNLETHGVMGEIAHDPAWSSACVERAQRMSAQHVNHACIYGWSLGNESGYGPGHAAMYGLIKEFDKTRICQYESGNPPANISDIRGTMYPSRTSILDMLTDPHDTRPVIPVEYLYQIRNSGGGMDKFVDLTRRYERFQGGFVWDWQDKSLPLPQSDGHVGFAHGGDFGERFIESREPVYMTNNGLVRADLTWKPVAWEVREAYAPILIDRSLALKDNVWLALRDTCGFVAVNRTLCESSLDYRLEVSAVDGRGETLRRCPVDLPALEPGESAALELSDALSGLEDAAPFYLTFRVFRRRDGEEVASRQFRCRDAVKPLQRPKAGPLPELTRVGRTLRFRAGGTEAVFSCDTGMLLSLSRDDISRIIASKLCWDRPYTGLDAQKGWGIRDHLDAVRSMSMAHAPAEVFQSADCWMVTSAFAGEFAAGRISWTLYGGGVIDCALDVKAADGAILPRFGVEFELPQEMERVSYLGLGPMENYADRVLSPAFGRYACQMDELGFDYAPPSENGGHGGTEELCLCDAAGHMLLARAGKAFHFDARRCTVEDLQRALHTAEVPRRDRVYLHLDAWHMPIGGDMAWSTTLDAASLPQGGIHTLRVRLSAENRA